MSHSHILRSALAENTRIAYAKMWAIFSGWCCKNDCDPGNATPDEIADFLVHLSSAPRATNSTIKQGEPLSMGTIQLIVSAIKHHYASGGSPSPTDDPKVKAILRGLSRSGDCSVRQVHALREHHIDAMLACCDRKASKPATNLIGLRDGAIISVGFACALRRSEICGLTVPDVAITDDRQRMIVTIKKSKTDRAGRGQKIPVPEGKNIRPISRLTAWLEASEISEGHVFQTMRRGGHLRGSPMHHSDIPRLIKHYAKAIGLCPENIAGHSLRAGFITSASAHHARLDKIMEISRHTNPATVMKYIRDADAFNDHAGASFL